MPELDADARVLPEPDASHDAVLLLGPLYHLLDRADRVRALAEAMLRGLMDVPGFTDLVRGDMTTGARRSTQDMEYGFTTAYFHHPDEIAGEIGEAGLELTDLLARTEHEPATLGATSHLLVVAR